MKEKRKRSWPAKGIQGDHGGGWRQEGGRVHMG